MKSLIKPKPEKVNYMELYKKKLAEKKKAKETPPIPVKLT